MLIFHVFYFEKFWDSNYMFRPILAIFRFFLESEVSYGQIYHIDDEISFTFYKLLLWRDY